MIVVLFDFSNKIAGGFLLFFLMANLPSCMLDVTINQIFAKEIYMYLVWQRSNPLKLFFCLRCRLQFQCAILHVCVPRLSTLNSQAAFNNL